MLFMPISTTWEPRKELESSYEKRHSRHNKTLMSKPVAKINRQRGLRYLIAIATILALVFVYTRFVSQTRTADPGNFASAGYISAAMQTEDGYRAVLVAPDGTVKEVPGYEEGVMDQPPVWSPDGQRVYFVSDRDNGESHVFRWNPSSDAVERRTIDKRTKSYVDFTVPGDPANKTALVISGGTIVELEPLAGTSKQLLPPQKLDASRQGEDGAAGQFEQLYASLGTSFKMARWTKDKQHIIAVMRRETGEALICQNVSMLPNIDLTNPEMRPVLIATGERIEFDIDPNSGKVVYTLQQFQWPDPRQIPPEFIENGRAKMPLRHMIGIYTPGAPAAEAPVAVAQDDKFCFGHPRLSPDGEMVMVSVGPYRGSGNMDNRNLVVMPFKTGGGSEGATTLVNTPAVEAEWSPDGKKIVFVGEGPTRRTLYLLEVGTGAEPKALTSKGVFRGPQFSPQE